MSVEILVLALVFLVLPLIQQLFQAARQRERSPQAPAPARPPRQPRPRGARPASPALPPLPDGPPVPVTSATIAPNPVLVQDVPMLASPAVTVQLGPSRPGETVGLRRRVDLRRAVASMTILGPCRAIDADEWPASDWRH